MISVYELRQAMAESQTLGTDVPVVHRGASSLGISGQDEIDVYIPITPSRYADTVILVSKLFGEPRADYPLDRTRFKAGIDGKKIDLFVVNEEGPSWLDGLKFEKHLQNNPDDLERYRQLKETNSGLSSQEYYRRKNEFINEIMSKI